MEVHLHQKEDEVDILNDEMVIMEKEHNREIGMMKSKLEHRMKDLVEKHSTVKVVEVEHHQERHHDHKDYDRHYDSHKRY